MILNEEQKKEIKRGMLVSLMTFVVGPILYFLIVLYIETPVPADGPKELLYYMLLGIAVFEPALYPLLERFQIAGFKRANSPMLTTAKLLSTLMIIKGAMVNAIYIYGVVAYLMTADFDKIYPFYIVGVFWSIFYWPRRDTIESKLQELEARC